MAQFRQYTATVYISDTEITIRTLIGNNEVAAFVLRDGSMDTNFKNAMAAHRDLALTAPATMTSLPSTVMTSGKWNKVAASGSITAPATTIAVPAGNSGHLVLHRDAGAFTMNYILNGGTVTAFTDGTVITAANGDTLAFSATGVPEQEFASGYVTDEDTAVDLDIISLYNSTPVP